METSFSVTPRKIMVTVKLRAGAPKDFQSLKFRLFMKEKFDALMLMLIFWPKGSKTEYHPSLYCSRPYIRRFRVAKVFCFCFIPEIESSFLL